ncbi:molybdopterin molybdotransferase MoeA [Gemmata sp.]|uniref:molybdopterin molybdotransferase MoeA n=1 Tax=Gemmata sp. TaxID=1914242 RepID=UPI003F71071F
MTDSSRFTDVRMKGFGPRAPVADVLAALDARTAPLPAEGVAIARLAGRVLAEAVASPVDVPAFERAAMDGYAVRAADTSPAGPLLVRGEAMPARPFSGTVGAGDAVRITTGAPIPDGADAVLMAELAEPHADGRVTAREALVAGKHIVRVGEDVAKGRVVLAAGRVLRPQDVGLLASIGVAAARVHRRPRVALLVTGNELLPPGDAPTGFRIVDSNSPMLAALVTRDGGEPLPVRYLADDFAVVRDAIRDADADAVLVSGGTSVGTADHAPAAVAELGELAFHGVALRPAGPLGVGFLLALSPLSRPIFLLPGNPVSCLCAYDLFAGRVVRRLGGRSWELPYRSETLPLASRVPSATGRTDYVRVRIEGGRVVPILGVGASNLSSAVAADGFVLVPPERDELPAGETVVVWRYDG